MNDTRQFYNGKKILITGGTGFLGLAIIEKLLRKTEVGAIYLLMREKKGKNIKARLEDLTKNPIFERLQEERTSSVFSKLIPIEGDVGSDELGLNADSKNLLINQVEIVIHSAATLDFQETLRPTVNTNLLGTRRVLTLSREMKHLVSFVHVSSAYVNSFLLETEEKLYPAPADDSTIINLVENSSDEQLRELTPSILGNHPNAYTFTKHLAEHEVNKFSSVFPCAIVRPSMITAAWKEPVPGWTNSKNGPQGFMMGAVKGVVRRLPVSLDGVYDYIPVDVVVNEILLAASYVTRNSSRGKLEIFHCTSSTINPFKWNLVVDRIDDFLHAYPLRSAVWYPKLRFHSSLLMYKISAIFLHFLPAIFLDLMIKVSGGRPILFRMHKNIWKSLGLLEKFIFTEWKFHNQNTVALSNQLSDIDKENFFIDIEPLQWNDYFENLAKGVLRYLHNEHPKYLSQAKRKDKILFYIHIIFQIVLHGLIWFIVSKLIGVAWIKIPFVPVLSYLILEML